MLQMCADPVESAGGGVKKTAQKTCYVMFLARVVHARRSGVAQPPDACVNRRSALFNQLEYVEEGHRLIYSRNVA